MNIGIHRGIKNTTPAVPRHNQKKILWKVQQLNHSTASFRYRCLIPLKYLADIGMKSEVYSDSDPINLTKDVAAIIFVKSFSRHDLKYAERAKSLGIPIIIDLCDNIFFQAENTSEQDLCEIEITQIKERLDYFLRIAKYSKMIVTPTIDLARIVRRALGNNTNVIVIPDAVETNVDLVFAKNFRLEERLRQLKNNSWSWLAKAYLSRLMNFLGYSLRRLQWIVRPPIIPIPTAQARSGINTKRLPLPQILWFGNAGNSYFGLSDLELIKQHLINVYKEVPFQLTVVSSSPSAFLKYVSESPFPARYVNWSSECLNEEFRHANLVVIPNRQNAFSVCKSANRALLALQNNVPVVATRTKALEPLKSSVVFDDWESGIKRYLQNPSMRTNDVQLAKEIIAAEYSGERIARYWARALENL